jgi:hypothetical protein
LYLAFFSFFSKDNILKGILLMKFNEANLFYYYLVSTLTIGIISLNSGITFAQEKNETSEIEDSPLITTGQIDESMETNIT